MKRDMIRYLAGRSVIAIILLLIGAACVLVNLERCHTEIEYKPNPYGYGLLYDFVEVCQTIYVLKVIGIVLIALGTIVLACSIAKAFWG